MLVCSIAFSPYPQLNISYRRQSNYHLDSNTYALVGDCDTTTYCDVNGTCALKGCRKDIVSSPPHCILLRASIDLHDSIHTGIMVWISKNFLPFVRWANCKQSMEQRAASDIRSCPDEGDQCLTQTAVGGACQKDRDGTLQPTSSDWSILTVMTARPMPATVKCKGSGRIPQWQRICLPKLHMLVRAFNRCRLSLTE